MGVDTTDLSVYHNLRMERWPSGLRRAPAKRMGGNSRVGSNPTRSANQKRTDFGPFLVPLRLLTLGRYHDHPGQHDSKTDVVSLIVFIEAAPG